MTKNLLKLTCVFTGLQLFSTWISSIPSQKSPFLQPAGAKQALSSHLENYFHQDHPMGVLSGVWRPISGVGMSSEVTRQRSSWHMSPSVQWIMSEKGRIA